MSKIQEKVKPGVEVFLKSHIELVKGKRLGLVTNPTGVDSRLNSIIDLFITNPDITLTALYGPEHGVRGNAQSGQQVTFYHEKKYDIPVFSLYGQEKKQRQDLPKNIDELMRSFDTQNNGKIPDNAMVEDLDVMIFDIQDVGTRVYTYMATLAYCMQVCAKKEIDLFILDRPNPLNGRKMEGPVLEYPEYSSFVGLYPIPLRHGMTIGELALMFNDLFLESSAELTVVPLQGWKRHMWFDKTGLPWIIPSPNMPTLDTATVYPGQVFLEGTNISEGRGTTKPFELFGAPWTDGHELTKRLNSLAIPGIRFRETWFTPVFSKYKEKLCGGAQLHVSDRNKYKPFKTILFILKTIMDMYPEKIEFHTFYFDRIMGTAKVRAALEIGESVEDITNGLAGDLKDFSEFRKPYLLY